MLDPEQPFLTTNTFDWNTRTVYAVFSYAEMGDGRGWSAVWMRNNEEIARESHLWDIAEAGRSGTRWVVYFEPDGRVLRGGDYSVSLYIEGELQTTASFQIEYHVTPTP
ncbi:MAG: hypothetical protein PVI59_11045 [Anaerolineae bacterium]